MKTESNEILTVLAMTLLTTFNFLIEYLRKMCVVETLQLILIMNIVWQNMEDVVGPIGLYRDVWIAAIASSRTRVTTLLGVMCNTSQ